MKAINTMNNMQIGKENLQVKETSRRSADISMIENDLASTDKSVKCAAAAKLVLSVLNRDETNFDKAPLALLVKSCTNDMIAARDRYLEQGYSFSQAAKYAHDDIESMEGLFEKYQTLDPHLKIIARNLILASDYGNAPKLDQLDLLKQSMHDGQAAAHDWEHLTAAMAIMPYEILLAQEAKGMPITLVEGEEAEVGIPEHLRSYKIFAHNHPEATPPSREDIANTFLFHRVEEVVSVKGTVRLGPGPNLQDKDWEQVAKDEGVHNDEMEECQKKPPEDRQQAYREAVFHRLINCAEWDYDIETDNLDSCCHLVWECANFVWDQIAKTGWLTVDRWDTVDQKRL